ncbi:MAG: UTP--glucose-1-phosphate uridylyltransferase GalU [Betaproteobacteria bacterium]|jgi:UTP--glucose-1-phosphate uridylyltransferase|nr:UTP--glucose-1-phosphate uridylyltransferase GalU [Rhodocyclaceae bacterium]MCA3135689.1 UTP--glucose-1-phosphate uridylyltransferase GalU [Rhodocyclaceae bacterium]MCA3141256.1 UTP--glucose-1-phosphate uridylyltransferase GalU [Rhodocyclaceae bacterium]MCA3145157.1 UTP--glucose-1-phosphate uridylyltransferase GalU [Rhodocyclaceae bacterium]MCE2897296.1 UTP--glucose-1-phosphate uridylyltransferase GalU [Betaproteobacteria bacterium]
MKPVTTAVFPVAGLGTRFLPATKASPKEMLPVVDKPLIQYAVEEAVRAGISQMVFITGKNKRAIEDHFDKAYELEAELEARGRTALLEAVRDIVPRNVSCVYVRQPEALGLGHAVLCARPVVGDNPFAVILADDLIDGEPAALAQMVEVYQERQSSVVAVQTIAPEESNRYGVVKPEEGSDGRLRRITGIVEKPAPAQAPSNLAVVGRYLLTPKLFHFLERIGKGSGGEIQLTDGIAQLLYHEAVFAWQFHGTRYDCGSKAGYLMANFVYALKHPEVGPEFAAFAAAALGGKGG